MSKKKNHSIKTSPPPPHKDVKVTEADKGNSQNLGPSSNYYELFCDLLRDAYECIGALEENIRELQSENESLRCKLAVVPEENPGFQLKIDELKKEIKDKDALLSKERDDISQTLSHYHKQSLEFLKFNNDTKDIVVRILETLSNIINDALDGKCDASCINDHIETFVRSMKPLGFEIYSFNRGDLIHSGDADKETADWLDTGDKSKNRTVYRCECIGFKSEGAKIEKRAKIIVYQYKEPTLNSNESVDKKVAPECIEKNQTDVGRISNGCFRSDTRTTTSQDTVQNNLSSCNKDIKSQSETDSESTTGELEKDTAPSTDDSNVDADKSKKFSAENEPDENNEALPSRE